LPRHFLPNKEFHDAERTRPPYAHPAGGGVVNGSIAGKRLRDDELRARFAHITRVLYDTSVPLPIVEREILPLFSANVEFLDPLVHVYGHRIFRIGRRGFHCTFKFDFDIAQIGVQMNKDGNSGRAIVDGIMNLNSLVVVTYPLRTILVYDFLLTEGGRNVSITRVEEMWSFGDLFENLPGIGRIYDVGRRGFGYFIAGMFWVSCAIRRK
jgi:hypothetical protein